MSYSNLFDRTLEHLRKNPLPKLPFEGISKVTPIEALANTITGDTAHENRQYNDAIFYFTRSINIDNNNSYVYEKRGLTYFLLGDYQNSLKDALKSISLTSTFHNNKIAGESYLQTGQYQNAIPYFTKAIDIFNDFKEIDKLKIYDYEHNLAVVCNNRGICYYKLGDLEKGILSAQEGIKYKNGYPNNHFIKGIMLLQLGQKQEALESLKAAERFGDPNARNVIQNYYT